MGFAGKELTQDWESAPGVKGMSSSRERTRSYLCISGADPSSGFLSSFFFLIVLGLCRFVPAFPSCGQSGLLFVVVLGLLIAVASLAADHRL